jgi:hypothetical protein
MVTALSNSSRSMRLVNPECARYSALLEGVTHRLSAVTPNRSPRAPREGRPCHPVQPVESLVNQGDGQRDPLRRDQGLGIRSSVAPRLPPDRPLVSRELF